MVLLEKTYELMVENHYEIGNVDSIILAEAPKMAPHIQAMRENIARGLHCDISKVNVKATRGEKWDLSVERKEYCHKQYVY